MPFRTSPSSIGLVCIMNMRVYWTQIKFDIYLIFACVSTIYICEYKLQLVHDKLNWISTALIEYKTTASIQSMMITQYKEYMRLLSLFSHPFHALAFMCVLCCVVLWCQLKCTLCIDDVECKNFNKTCPKKTNHIGLDQCGTKRWWKNRNHKIYSFLISRSLSSSLSISLFKKSHFRFSNNCMKSILHTSSLQFVWLNQCWKP